MTVIDSTSGDLPAVIQPGIDPVLKAIYLGRIQRAKSQAEVNEIYAELGKQGFPDPNAILGSDLPPNSAVVGPPIPLDSTGLTTITGSNPELGGSQGSDQLPAPFLSGRNPELNGSAGRQTALDSTGLTTVLGGNPELNGGGLSRLASSSPASSTLAPPGDLRVRLAALNPDDVYSGAKHAQSILSILATTGGMIFPYTPQISFSQAVSYADLQLVHSNTDYPAYTRTPSVTISVTGKFTVQNQREGRYAMAAIHFLRTASKSYFGETDARAGTAGLPPPVLLFSGYGPYMFSNVRVILKSHSWAFDENMDTISVSILGKTVRLPALFSMQLELQVVQTPQRMLTKFSFDAFANGDLLSDGFL